MKLELTFYQDPGHGWLQVSHDLINRLGIGNKITTYSYMDSHSAYLEEDCDLSLFMKEAEKAGFEISFYDRITNYDSPIRNYQRYTYIGG
jgi:hypothetical protein